MFIGIKRMIQSSERNQFWEFMDESNFVQPATKFELILGMKPLSCPSQFNL